jgi:5'(3')-deoxyribonucleotidase
MSKPTLAIDIDEVLFPYVQEFVLHHNDKYATDLLPVHFTSYRFEDIIEGIDQAEAIQRVYEFCDVDHVLIEPITDAQEGVKRLSKKYDLVLLTARHPRFQNNTRRWLERYFPGGFVDLVMIGFEYDPTVEPRTKASVCKDINAVALVDDSPKYVTQATDVGIRGILFGDYPWNQVELAPGVIRVKGWLDLAEHFGV